ncbi:MAG: hypothetical protein ACI8S6_002775 [Myxococcota bacterium]
MYRATVASEAMMNPTPSTLLFLLTGCSAPFVETAAEVPSSLDTSFQRAAAEYSIPRDLLVALAWSTSRLQHDAGLHDHGLAAHGMMGLREEISGGPSLERAAWRLGVAPEALMADPELNILGAAAELRAAADAYTEANDLPVDTLEEWAGVIGWYAGVDHAGLQRSFGKEIFSIIEQGLDVTLDSGESIRIDARPINIPGYDLQPVGSTSSDYWGTANFVAAHSGNYSNASRSASDIHSIVVHTAQGSYSSVSSWFANSAASSSAHYVIRSSDGEVTQMVWEEDVAWHAGHSATNWDSIGIEQEGYIEAPGTWYTDEMYASLAALISDICDRYSIPRDRDHIIGHNEVPGCAYSGGGASCHSDPGSGFDWDKLMSLLSTNNSGSGSGTSTGSGSSSGDTGSLVGYVRENDIYDSSAGISGATVSLSTGEAYTTSADGWFRFDGVPTGAVDLTVSASGFETEDRARDISADATAWSSIALFDDGSSSTPGYTYTPSSWQTVYGPDVTMSWDEPGSQYQVAVYWYSSSGWADYYTYTTSDPSKSFWPVVDDTYYAFAVRSKSGSSWGGWSALNYYYFNN